MSVAIPHKLIPADLIGSKFTHNIASAVSTWRVKQLNIITEVGADLTIKSIFLVVHKKQTDAKWTTFETVHIDAALIKYNSFA